MLYKEYVHERIENIVLNSRRMEFICVDHKDRKKYHLLTTILLQHILEIIILILFNYAIIITSALKDFHWLK